MESSVMDLDSFPAKNYLKQKQLMNFLNYLYVVLDHFSDTGKLCFISSTYLPSLFKAKYLPK